MEIAMDISAARSSLIGCWLASLFCLFIVTLSAWPQGNQGAVEGAVVDPSGAALTGCKLTAINDATRIKFQTTSDSNALFSFPVLPVGTYTIEIAHPAFATLTQKNPLFTTPPPLTPNLP